MSKMKVNFFSLHIGDFLGGVISMDAEEIGAYTMLLIAHYQVGEEGLPNDDGKLAKIAKVTPAKWSKIKSAILSKFEQRGVCLVNLKVLGELEKMKQKSTIAKDKALKRWNTHDAEAMLEPMPNSCPEDANHKPIEEAKASSVDEVKTGREKPAQKPTRKPPPEKPPKSPDDYRYFGKVIRLDEDDFEKLRAVAGMSVDGFAKWLDREDDYLDPLPEDKRKAWWFFINGKVKELAR